MEYETKLEKFKRISGIYALKTFILGFVFILAGIVITLFLKNNWYIILSAIGFFIVLWAVSEGKQED